MKSISIYFILVLLTMTSINITARATTDHPDGQKTENIKVWGKCSMCKNRIENAAKAAGATSASWDIKTKVLTVSFDQSNTDSDSISRKIASAGHDTEKYRAPDDVYDKLPSCCHYERRK